MYKFHTVHDGEEREGKREVCTRAVNCGDAVKSAPQVITKLLDSSTENEEKVVFLAFEVRA